MLGHAILAEIAEETMQMLLDSLGTPTEEENVAD